MSPSTGFRLADVPALLDRPTFREKLEQAEADGAIPEEVYGELARAGLFALGVPEGFGGFGLTVGDRIGLHARVARISASLHSILIVHEMVAYAIAQFGHAGVRERWLARLASGRAVGAFTLTEPGGGSDFEQVRTTATGEAEGFRLDGAKSWASSGLRATLFVVFARSDRGATAFLVPRDTPGLTVSVCPPMQAFRATSMADVRLRECVIGPECRLGPEGFGFLRVATACLSIGRVLVAAGALAVAAAALDELIAHAKARLVGQQPLADYQLVRKVVTDAYLGIESGRLLTREAATALDGGAPDCIRRAIVAKLAAADAAVRVTQDALRLQGAAGLTADSPVLRRAAEAHVYSTIEGTVEALSAALGGNLLRSGSDCEEALSACARR